MHRLVSYGWPRHCSSKLTNHIPAKIDKLIVLVRKAYAKMHVKTQTATFGKHIHREFPKKVTLFSWAPLNLSIVQCESKNVAYETIYNILT